MSPREDIREAVPLGADGRSYMGYSEILGLFKYMRVKTSEVILHILVFRSAVIASLSRFLIWSFVDSFAYLIVLAVAVWRHCFGTLAPEPRIETFFAESAVTMNYCLVTFGRGFCVIASGLISAALLAGD